MGLILQTWHHRVDTSTQAVVLPDGCRDVIQRRLPGREPQWFLSELQSGPRRVELMAGTELTGFRLSPGARFEAGWVDRLGEDPQSAAGLVSELTKSPAALTEALMALCEARTVAQAARRCGVSPRSLQRQVVGGTRERPVFWLRLARARRAARQLTRPGTLAEIAADADYADQAHMSREFRRWFGASPARLRDAPGLIAQLAQPGLATAEQISTR